VATVTAIGLDGSGSGEVSSDEHGLDGVQDPYDHRGVGFCRVLRLYLETLLLEKAGYWTEVACPFAEADCRADSLAVNRSFWRQCLGKAARLARCNMN